MLGFGLARHVACSRPNSEVYLLRVCSRSVTNKEKQILLFPKILGKPADVVLAGEIERPGDLVRTSMVQGRRLHHDISGITQLFTVLPSGRFYFIQGPLLWTRVPNIIFSSQIKKQGLPAGPVAASVGSSKNLKGLHGSETF